MVAVGMEFLCRLMGTFLATVPSTHQQAWRPIKIKKKGKDSRRIGGIFVNDA